MHHMTSKTILKEYSPKSLFSICCNVSISSLSTGRFRVKLRVGLDGSDVSHSSGLVCGSLTCSGNIRVEVSICGSSTDGVNSNIVGQDGGVNEGEEGGLGGGTGGGEFSSGI